MLMFKYDYLLYLYVNITLFKVIDQKDTVHSYDILANPLYLDDFQYVTAAEDDRDEMIIDDDDDEGNDAAQSDLVRVCLNLAYMTEDKAR